LANWTYWTWHYEQPLSLMSIYETFRSLVFTKIETGRNY